MNLKSAAEVGGNGLQYLISFAQIEEWLRIFGIILSVIISILIIIDKVINWYKKAKADGKITEDEVKEGIGIIKEGAEDIKRHIDNKDNGKQ